MEIINKSVRDLVPYENNPRNNDEAVEYVAASIREFGFKVPIVIDRDGVIVAGHTRLKAALKLGLDEVPCIVADDLTPEQVAAFRLADNKVSEHATWAEDKLVEELKKLGEFDMTKFGFDAELTEKDPEDIIQDEVPALPRKAKSKLGQIYQLGRHRLIVGDSTDPEVIDKLMDGATADLWITDPPYNVALGYNDTPEEAKKRRRRTDGKVVQNDQFADEAQYINFLVKAFEVVRDHLRAGGGLLRVARLNRDDGLRRGAPGCRLSGSSAFDLDQGHLRARPSGLSVEAGGLSLRMEGRRESLLHRRQNTGDSLRDRWS